MEDKLLTIGLAVFGGVGATFLKDIFYRGKQSAALKHFMETVNSVTAELKSVQQEIKEVQFKVSAHQERMGSISRDNTQINDTLDKLDATITKNSVELSHIASQLAGNKATMEGLNNLLQNIFSGNLVVRGQK